MREMSDLSEIVGMFKALGDAGRLKIVLALRDGEKSVSSLADESGADTSLVSQRLKNLFLAGILDKRRDGQQIYYRIKDEHVTSIILNAVNHASDCKQLET